MAEIEQIQKLEDEIKNINTRINNENIEISKLKEQTKKYQLSNIIFEFILIIIAIVVSFILINNLGDVPKDNSGFSLLVEMVPKMTSGILNIIMGLMIPIILGRLCVLGVKTNNDFKLNKEINKRKNNVTNLENQKIEKINMLNIFNEKLEKLKTLSDNKIKLAEG